MSIVVGEDFYHIIRTFCTDLRNFPLIRALGDLFCQEFHPLHPVRTNERRPTSEIDSVAVHAEEPFVTSPEEWFLKRNRHQNYEDDGDPNFVFDVLDSVIVGTMERLKKLRLGFSCVGLCQVLALCNA
ncbi:uncharacterized protein LOC110034896 isoform X2 [Phalaenopsis equestris]|uniref:uncharacterized protein LOC110034896 isoform X2 n=1 Tax=Phalaenopsis equestris TaxID=78828 RepID=UPI0009E5DFA1|nr:uncharacterized protein LOC110034896 isoform X2 [Phalaenopsis equestris]